MKVLEALKFYNIIIKELIVSITIRPTKWFEKFFIKLFDTVVSIPGKINFSSMSRYSGLTDRTFRNWFARSGYNWLEFNRNAAISSFGARQDIVLAFDPAHIKKSGQSTYGIGRYWSGVEKRAALGLEIMAFGAISITQGKCMMLEAVQTPPVNDLHKQKDMTMLDWYLALITGQKERLLDVSKIITGDAFFSRKSFIDGITDAGFTFVGRLIPKQRLRYLADESDNKNARHKKGRKFTYAGKMDPMNPELHRIHPCHVKGAVRAYWVVVNCIAMNRDIKVVVAEFRDTGTVMYFSTDVLMEAEKIVRIYRLRFQIEFGIRDAKQYTGLNDSQARSREKLDFAFNLSFAVRNVLDILSRKYYHNLSIGQLKSLLTKAFLVNLIRRKFGGRPNMRLIDEVEAIICTLIGVRA